MALQRRSSTGRDRPHAELHVVHPYHTGRLHFADKQRLRKHPERAADLDVTPLPPSGIGGVDLDFSAAKLATTDSSSSVVRSVLVQADGKVIAVGPFQTVDGSPAQGIVRLNRDGTLDPSFSLFQNPDFARTL